MSAPVSWRHAWRKAISYLYILYWDRRYFTRLWSITNLVPLLLVTLSCAEVLGSLLHFAKWLDDATATARIIIAVALLAVALIMVWHHSRLENRVERHQAIMAMTRVLCARTLEPYDPEDTACVSAFVHNTLEGFILALEHERDMGVMNASLVARDGLGQPFRILDQYPSGTFLNKIRLDPEESAAAIAATAENEGTLVYVPSTKRVHGIRLIFEENATAAPEFLPSNASGATTTRIIENAFQPIDLVTEGKVLRSLLCMCVPNRIPVTSRVHDQLGIARGSEMVLCLGMHRPNRMGELDFNAIQVTARLLALGLAENF